jgi:hypothetical protein
MNSRICARVALTAIILASVVPWADAGSVTYSSSGTDHVGPVSATVTITAISGGIDVTVTNTFTGTLAKGQAISALGFQMDGGLSTPTGFTETRRS